MSSELVPADRIYEMFQQALGETQLAADFEQVNRNHYAKQLGDDIIGVLRLEAWKGATYSLSWGVSLSYIPNTLKTKPVFHRTIKSSRFDLWEDSRSVAEREGLSWKGPLVTRLGDEHQARRDLSRTSAWASPRADAWWRSASTLDGVLAIAEDQVVRKPHVIDSLHWPRPHLIVILTLARLGRIQEATDAVGQYGPMFDSDELARVNEAIFRVGALAST